MYTENNNRSGSFIRDIILKILFLALFIFLLLWLYPKNTNTKPFYDAIFNNNINMMKEVAEDYYTVQRLPEKVGEKTKLTLQEMLDMKLLLPFTDENGEYCDTKKSYVQVTKLENDEYELKVNLSCKNRTDYIIEYLGCHDLCVNGECQTVVSTLEYKFVRELFKGRKLTTVNLYKYEYTKDEKQAYTMDQQVTYYKGRKKASSDIYSYEYVKNDKVPYEIKNNVTYYKGKKKVSDDVYSYKYTKNEVEKTTVDKQVTYYRGSKKVSDDVYSYKYTKNITESYSIPTTITYYKGKRTVTTYIYEYQRTVTNTTPGKTTCQTYYNQSSVPSNATNVTTNKSTVNVPDGYTYSPWTTTGSYTSTSPCSTSSSDTSRTVANGYSISTGTCKTSNCPASSIVYNCTTQTRTKTLNYKTQNITTYTYKICTTGQSTTTSSIEKTWAASNPGNGWTATGNSKVNSSNDEYTGWVTSLPAGYTLVDSKTETTYSTGYRTVTKTEWSTEDLTKDGWTRTGEKQLVSAAKYDYTGWVTSLPSGYTQIDKKTVIEKETVNKTVTKTEWSTEDLTKQGWTRTGEKQLVSAAKYDYTNWVKELPAGYEQTDKKVETEVTIGYKEVTNKQWSTEDLTKQGWTKTGNKKLYSAGQYVYTDWVKELPAGYEQTDKKTVTEKVKAYKTVTKTEWSTEDLTKDGWTKTGKKEKIGEKKEYVYTDWVTSLPKDYEQIDKKTETKWSSEKSISGWTLTKDTRVKEDK